MEAVQAADHEQMGPSGLPQLKTRWLLPAIPALKSVR